MKKKIVFKINLIFFLLFGWLSQGMTLEKPTHEVINQNIAQETIIGFSLNNYLMNNLGYKVGIETLLPGYSEAYKKEIQLRIWQWLGEGGKSEDEPDGLLLTVANRGRSNNHFHNPLKPYLNNSGLDAYVGPLHYTGQSSVLWGQNLNQDPGLNIGGKWSWHDARNYFYKGLTLTSKMEREKAFSNMFRALGHLTHLIQDASVPAHTRNDIHIGFHYEIWLEAIRLKEPGTFANFLSGPVSFNPSILSNDAEPLAPIPIAKIIDSRKYYGGNPQETANTTGIGLAEYANANFFSENTIFSNIFPYPSRMSVEKQDYPIPDPRNSNGTVKRQYYKKIGDGETNYRLATVGLLKDYITQYFPFYRGQESEALDGGVYKDYAEKLLPRAIGYSSGLLKYFFRGSLQVTAIPIFYSGSLNLMRLKIKNLADETMSNGEFALTYQYTPPGGSSDGSNDIFRPAWAVDGSAFAPCIELRGQQEMVIDFRMDSPLSRNDYEALKFTLAYKGNLGNETGAVIGKTFNPGRVIFEEEWDKPLPGNYVWAHTGFNWDSFNPGAGSSVNQIVGDYLTKENTRTAGSQLARVNESFLGYGSFPGPFPLPITPNTYLMYRIDEMSMNPLGVGYQIMLLSFTDKLTLQISQEGQMVYWNPTTAYYTFNPGDIVVDNIYESFQRAGVPIPPLFQINFLGFDQRLNVLANPASADHVQRMNVDFIRIVEANVE